MKLNGLKPRRLGEFSFAILAAAVIAAVSANDLYEFAQLNKQLDVCRAPLLAYFRGLVSQLANCQSLDFGKPFSPKSSDKKGVSLSCLDETKPQPNAKSTEAVISGDTCEIPKNSITTAPANAATGRVHSVVAQKKAAVQAVFKLLRYRFSAIRASIPASQFAQKLEQALQANLKAVDLTALVEFAKARINDLVNSAKCKPKFSSAIWTESSMPGRLWVNRKNIVCIDSKAEDKDRFLDQIDQAEMLRDFVVENKAQQLEGVQMAWNEFEIFPRGDQTEHNLFTKSGLETALDEAVKKLMAKTK